MKEAEAPEINYGNWVSRKLIYVLGFLSLVFFGLSYFSLFYLIGGAFFLIPLMYFVYAYREFSSSGGNLQTKIRDLVLEHLEWDGKGKIIDIGCGNGALTIETAKKYPELQVTGIDYWGGQWEYSQKACEANARNSEVGERTSFQKASASALPFTDDYFDGAISNLVFHEVHDTRDKKEVVKEALRVVKKGGYFAFQDLFLLKGYYGPIENLLATIKSWGIQEVNFINTGKQEFIPKAMRLPFMVGQIGVIYGKK